MLQSEWREAAINGAWERVEEAMGKERRLLRPPVSVKNLNRLEQLLGQSLPAELQTFLKRHDGAKADQNIWSNHQLLGARRIGVLAMEMRDLLAEGLFDDSYWKSSWIPLTHADGDAFCLDPKTGRVISFQYGEGPRGATFASIETWLRRLAQNILKERKSEGTIKALLAEGMVHESQLPKRARERLKKLDDELELFIVSTVNKLGNDGSASREDVALFRPISRLPVNEVLKRAIAQKLIQENNGRIQVTSRGKQLAKVALGR